MSSSSLPGPSKPRAKVNIATSSDRELPTTAETAETSLMTPSQSTLPTDSSLTMSTQAHSASGSTALLHVSSLKKKKSFKDNPDRHIIFGIGKDERDFWRNEETLEKPPIIDHYRKPVEKTDPTIARPSMFDLMHGSFRDLTAIPLDDYRTESSEKERKQAGESSDRMLKYEAPEAADRVKFGWIQGVMIRCVLNILGVMLFLRVSWVAAQAGLLMGSVVILLSATVTTLTTLSMSAISTNGDVKGGGTYFMISRSLGPEFGGSIGIMFSFANAVGAAMHIVGLSETVRDLVKYNGGAIIDNGINDVRVVGLAMCTMLIIVVFIGTAFESRTQVALLVILTASLINYILGTFMPVTEFQKQRGITGYSFETFTDNLMPAWRGHDFFSIFGIFFPAATGIMAGANISGDLRNPSMAIPKGTLCAIAITTSIYLMALWLTGVTTVRDASGITAAMLAAANDSSIYSEKLNCAQNFTCEFGLMNFYQIMEVESLWGPLVTAGIFAATLSSALASLVSAPKIFQAVCKDRLFPYIKVFGKGYGNEDEPRRAYGLVFVITMLVILIGDLNVIAPIISNFFLATYALINYSCFDASFARSPGFRPTFKYYNMWVSLLGASLCVSIMFIISWWTALLTFIFFAIIFVYVQRRKPDANWGSSTQANSYRNALMSVLKLTNTEEHVKNYRPQLLVLTGNPADRATLVDFASNITKGNSLLVCGHVVRHNQSDRVFECIAKLSMETTDWMKNRKVKAFYCPVANINLRAGTDTLLQTSGLGKLKPNILMLGFKADWDSKSTQQLTKINDYFGIIQDAFDNDMGVCILRNGDDGLDYSNQMKEHGMDDTPKLDLPEGSRIPSRQSSMTGLDKEKDQHASSPPPSPAPISSTTLQTSLSAIADNSIAMKELGKRTRGADNLAYAQSEPGLSEKDKESRKAPVNTLRKSPIIHISKFVAPPLSRTNPSRKQFRKKQKMTNAQRELTASINRFKTKVKDAIIDVWWLYDDGGLTLLIPHLLTLNKSYLEGGKLRVFTIASSHSTMEKEQKSMVALLSKFRIRFTDVFVIPDISKKPNDLLASEFEARIAAFRKGPGDNRQGLITESELVAQKNRTDRHLRCRELLLQNSTNADLIVMTMPVPRKNMVSSCLYMAWLDTLSRGLPPTLLIRGNQTSVLTFYS